MEPLLSDAMLEVLRSKQRFIEKYLLGLSLTHSMFVAAFAPVAFIPLKAFDASQIEHSCILPLYTKRLCYRQGSVDAWHIRGTRLRSFAVDPSPTDGLRQSHDSWPPEPAPPQSRPCSDDVR